MRKLWSISPPGSFFNPEYYSTDPGIPNTISPDEFSSMVANHEFAVHNNHGHISIGIPKESIRAGIATQRIALMDVHMEGVQQLKSWSGLDARYVFLTPSIYSFSEPRLMANPSEETDRIRIHEPWRQALADFDLPCDYNKNEHNRAELEYAREPGVYDLILDSDDLDEAFKTLVTFMGGGEE